MSDAVFPPIPDAVGEDVSHFLVYNTKTGAIKFFGFCRSDHVAAQANPFMGPDLVAVEISEQEAAPGLPDKFFMVDGALTPRQEIVETKEYTIAADGIAEVSFPVPPGTTVDGVAITDNLFEFASNVLGDTTHLFASTAGFKPAQVIIHAV